MRAMYPVSRAIATKEGDRIQIVARDHDQFHVFATPERFTGSEIRCSRAEIGKLIECLLDMEKETREDALNPKAEKAETKAEVKAEAAPAPAKKKVKTKTTRKQDGL